MLCSKRGLDVLRLALVLKAISALLTSLARVFTGIGTGILNAITPVWATETAEYTSRGQSFLLSSLWTSSVSSLPIGLNSERHITEFQDIRNISKLETDASKHQSYFAMSFGIGSGKPHTARRLQLVIWLQILQEWTGIAGVMFYGPRVWVSGLNGITYMVSEQLFQLSRNFAYRSSFPLLFASLPSIALVVAGLFVGGTWARAFAVSLLVDSLRPQLMRLLWHTDLATAVLPPSLCSSSHFHFRRYLAHCPVAVSCRDLPSTNSCPRQCLGRSRPVHWQWLDGASLAYNLQQAQREDSLHFRRY